MTARFADHILPAGLLSARPAATAVPVGTLYPATDSGIIYQSDGTTWSTWRPAADALPLGGATGQVLTKQSATDGDADWETPSGGGGSASRFDDPADPAWGADLGYDLEFETDDASGTLPSGWSWVNQGTASWAQKWGAGIFTPRGGGASENHCMIVRNIPTEATWTLTTKLIMSTAAAGMWHRTGVVLRQSSTGKYTFMGHSIGGTFSVHLNDWSSPGSYSGSETDDRLAAQFPSYYRIIKNAGGTFTWKWSADGVSWRTTQAARTAYAAFDQVGILTASLDAAPDPVALHWFRVR